MFCILTLRENTTLFCNFSSFFVVSMRECKKRILSADLFLKRNVASQLR